MKVGWATIIRVIGGNFVHPQSANLQALGRKFHNRCQLKMNLSRKDDLENLITKHSRRCQKLRERLAIEGISADPKVSIEIEDIEIEIQRLQAELNQLGQIRLGVSVGEDGEATERRFDCGHRIKEAREDTGLSVSELIELINFSSEGDFKNIEKREEECPLSVINQMSQFCGISSDWLKHGTGYKYPYSDLDPYNLDEFLDELNALNPIALYFCTETKQNRVVLVAQFSDYNWKVIGFSFRLDLWKWIDDYWYIPRIYETIDKIHETFYYKIHGRIYSKSLFYELTSMMVYPKKIIYSLRMKSYILKGLKIEGQQGF